MEKIVNVDGEKFIVRELFAVEFDDFIALTDRKESVKRQVMVSTGLKEEDYNKLTIKKRSEIIKAINEINGFLDFQKNSSQESQS